VTENCEYNDICFICI